MAKFVTLTRCCWAISKEIGGGSPQIKFQYKNSKVFQPLNLTSSGEKVAPTQVVEHHLPTYASLSLVRQKRDEKTCKENRKWNESTAWWKATLKYASFFHEPIAWNVSKWREAKSYIISASGNHQRIVVVENNLVCESGWINRFLRATYICPTRTPQHKFRVNLTSWNFCV